MNNLVENNVRSVLQAAPHVKDAVVAVVDCESGTVVSMHTIGAADDNRPALLTPSEAVATTLVLRDVVRMAVDKSQANGSASEDGHTGSERSFGTFSFGGSTTKHWRASVGVDITIETDRRTISMSMRPPQAPSSTSSSEHRRLNREMMVPATIVSRRD